ncbi:hypothetical protein CRG98_038833 [Punica granatum]|uniref:Uncharacterized protein n=1 Tax=Punica granatum TaxID=22663 RepID=A0A2I0IA16_PUNGR|nr:hypothetical protein CRG98_038833 [Punica granatum]
MPVTVPSDRARARDRDCAGDLNWEVGVSIPTSTSRLGSPSPSADTDDPNGGMIAEDEASTAPPLVTFNLLF